MLSIDYLPLLVTGLVLYSGQEPGKGDFISFGLKGGKAELRFDAGSGPTVILSHALTLNAWYTARLRREDREGEGIDFLLYGKFRCIVNSAL